MTDTSAFTARITCREWDVQLVGNLPPGVVIEVRDYRLAQDAEAGTTVEDAQGRPYFGHLWGEPAP